MRTWDKAKDALLGAAGSVAIWLFVQMRTDFKEMTAAITNLTVKIETISSQSSSNNEGLKDHEWRLRYLEKRARN